MPPRLMHGSRAVPRNVILISTAGQRSAPYSVAAGFRESSSLCISGP